MYTKSLFLLLFSFSLSATSSSLSWYDMKKSWKLNAIKGPSVLKNVPLKRSIKAHQAIDFLGYKIASPIGMPACAWMNGKGVATAAQLGYDVVTYKTIRNYAHPCHNLPNLLYAQPHPDASDSWNSVVASTSHSSDDTPTLVNSFGNGSFDADYTSKDIKAAKASLSNGQILIVSIYGEDAVEFAHAALIAHKAGADIVEINLSCPNVTTENTYYKLEKVFEIAKGVVTVCNPPLQGMRHVPVILKLGAIDDTKTLESIILTAHEAGVHGISGINTIPVHAVDENNTNAFGPKRSVAGLSGAPLKEKALTFVKNARDIIDRYSLNMPIVAMGGVTTKEDFDLFLDAGATIVQTATGAFFNPLLALEYHEYRHKKELAQKLYQKDVIKFGSFTFRSGIQSSNYCDMRTTFSHPDIFKELVQLITDKIEDTHCDHICPVPTGATPFATAAAYTLNRSLIVPRKEQKSYGLNKTIEGAYEPGQTCILIEDIITTGASVLDTIKTVEDAGLKVEKIIVLVDREQGGKDALTSRGYKVESIFTLSEMMNFLQIK